MNTKYIATVHTLIPNRAPIEFIFDVCYVSDGFANYFIDQKRAAMVPTSMLVVYTPYNEQVTEDQPQEHTMD